jgi:hypothetical protein
MAADLLAQVGDRVTTLLVNSPLYSVMVKKARATMKQTAEGAGIVRVCVGVHATLCWCTLRWMCVLIGCMSFQTFL